MSLHQVFMKQAYEKFNTKRFAATVNGGKLLTIFAKKHYFRCSTEF